MLLVCLFVHTAYFTDVVFILCRHETNLIGKEVLLNDDIILPAGVHTANTEYTVEHRGLATTNLKLTKFYLKHS